VSGSGHEAAGPDPAGSGQPATDLAQALQQAVAFHQQGRLDAAERLYRTVLAAQPGQFDALHFLGILRAQQGDGAEAVRLISRALDRRPDSADAHSNLGNVYQQLGRHADAIASYERALTIRPDFADALYNRGNALRAAGRRDEALASYERALALAPAHARALANLGNLLQELNRFEDALASYERALALRPDDAEAHNGRGAALYRLNRHEEALASCERALALQPDHVAAHCNRGNILQALGRRDEAPACYERALALRPDDPDALHGLAGALLGLNRHEEAARAYARLLEAAPDYPFARGRLLYARLQSCDWDGLADLVAAIGEDVRAGRLSAEPFGHQAVCHSVRELKRCAELYAAHHCPPALPALWNGERYSNARIRIGYVSGEFRHQATSILMVELFERHDRGRFELFAFDNGWDDGSGIRERINRAFDEIVDIGRLGDRAAAMAIRQRRIDILVNLNGYFGAARQGVFALRPCPIQVNYLGFPGTLGAPYMDYLVADRHVIPPQDREAYTEQVVYLPECYQPNDSRRRIAERAPTRAEAGLPEGAFVFCCFNNSYKILPQVFEVWMRLLARLPGAVLWLLEDNAAAARNLQREAAARGVAPARLVFAARARLDEHLARHRLADLFLDTLPYTAHTTGSDALWAGLPLLTCEGATFPARVAASLLRAAGLPELVTRSLEEYEALALRLATEPARLAALRAQLARNRASCALFDAARRCRHLEAAYLAMWQRQQRGELPAAFAVDP
jgi:predicted O-linked N-acetylglucosamine transferase (SPINDLY family)